jgi:hypothetical protein
LRKLLPARRILRHGGVGFGWATGIIAKAGMTSMNYDIREHLTPRRATIAMWDFSWLNAHYPGGSFADFDRVTDELLERDFNTVRIEAFPWIVGQLKRPDEVVTISGNPLANWGMSDRDRAHAVGSELAEFMAIARRKRFGVILSTWGYGCREYPDRQPEAFTEVWEKTLSFLQERDLLDHVLYIDLDQEFPHFSVWQQQLNALATGQGGAKQGEDAMAAAGRRKPQRGLAWNDDQLDFVSSLEPISKPRICANR